MILITVPQLLADTENHTHSGGFWEEVFAVTFDPAHIMAELFFTIVFDFLVIAVMYKIVFKKFILPRLRRDIHKEIDEAHGETHLDNDSEPK